MAESGIKPHAIMVEFLFQGHITPFVNLALALASKGCTVTYVQTEFIHHRMSTATAKPESGLFSGARHSGLDICHMTISDGFPLDFDRDANFVEFYESIVRDFPVRVGELVGEIVESERGRSSGRPRSLSPTLTISGLRQSRRSTTLCMSPSGLCRLCASSIGHHLAMLQHKLGISCSYDDYKDDDLQELRGVQPRNIRDCIKYDPPKDDPFYPEILRETTITAHLQVREADFILCNTVEGLEPETISTLNQKQKLPAYTIGPTAFLTTTSTVSSLRSEVDCLEWLSSKPPSSVLYVAFGSIAQTERRVIQEIAHGLRGSRVNFLWVLRPDTAGDDSDVVLPPQFVDQVSGRGLVFPWCDQRKVLGSPAIGGFLTHCGWSSTLESIWYEIPMICYPIFTDQPNNRNLVVYDWEIGINLCDKEEISREEVVEKIQRLMMSECENEKLKTKMKKVNKVMHYAVAQCGSSDRNLDKFLDDLKDRIFIN